jgi:CBS domain-containing protein
VAGPEDEIGAALETMKNRCVRRLPVVECGGAVVGILSVDDLVRAAGRWHGVPGRTLIQTLQAIGGAHHPSAHVLAIS